MSAPELSASPLLRWPGSIPGLSQQRQLAERALAHVEAGQLIGIGSGAAAYLLLRALGASSASPVSDVEVLCASYETESAALALGLVPLQLGSAAPDWALDGADEVDPDGRMLKHHAGALVKTKLLWGTARRMFVAAADTAFVPALGRDSALPVEVHREAAPLVARELAGLGASDVSLRLSSGKDGPVFTESGNLLLDARFTELAPGLHAAVTSVTGVVETGLLEGLAFETL
jgi:ribose 5-phosphate isomerase A